jgi:hypothetical protein
MLAAALHVGVAAYIEQLAFVRDGNDRWLVVHNGEHAWRDVVAGTETVTVTAPRVTTLLDPELGCGKLLLEDLAGVGAEINRISPRCCRRDGGPGGLPRLPGR